MGFRTVLSSSSVGLGDILRNVAQISVGIGYNPVPSIVRYSISFTSILSKSLLNRFSLRDNFPSSQSHFLHSAHLLGIEPSFPLIRLIHLCPHFAHSYSVTSTL